MNTLILFQLLIFPMFYTFIWFITNIYLHFQLSNSSLLFSALISILFCIWISRFFPKEKIHFEFSVANLGLLIGLFFLVGTNLIFNYYYPPSIEFDAITMYDQRAKIFIYNHEITDINNDYHGAYPLFTSLVHTSLYLIGLNNPKVFYSYLVIPFLLLFYQYIYKKHGTTVGLLASLLLYSTPVIFYQSRIAYTNFPYLVYLGIFSILFTQYMNKPSKKLLISSSIFATFGFWIRPGHELFYLFYVLLILASLIKRKSSLIDLVIPVSIYFPSLLWRYYQTYILSIKPQDVTGISLLIKDPSTFLSMVPATLLTFLDNFFELSYAGITGYAIFILAVYFALKLKSKIMNNEFLIVLVFFAWWFATAFLVRTSFIEYGHWYGVLIDSMRRLFIVCYPSLIVFLVSLLPKRRRDVIK